jgi:hypothetical protein
MPEVVMVVEASAGESAKACSTGHRGKPGCTKPAASRAVHGETTTVEGSTTAVKAATAMSSATAAMSATATTAARGRIHRHRHNADCRNRRESDQHFPEHGTLLLQERLPETATPIIPDVTQIHFRDVDDWRGACFAAIAIGKMQLDRLLESYMAGADAERIAHGHLVTGL